MAKGIFKVSLVTDFWRQLWYDIPMNTSSEAAIWERVIHPDDPMTPKVARAVLKLRFRQDDQKRMHILALKAQAGTLSTEEVGEIENYDRVGTILSIMKSRARKVLKPATNGQA